MNKKKPVFTCILSWLNPIIPPSIIYLLGISLLLAYPSGERVRWLDLHFQAVIAGWFLCLAYSLGYYVRVRTGRVQPSWRKNLILIIIGYAAIPLASMLIPEKPVAKAPPLLMEFWIISILLFSTVTASIKKKARNKEAASGESGNPRFTSPFWIAAFTVAHYLAFFATLLLLSLSINAHIYSIAWLLHKINILLRQPLYNVFTKELVIRYLPGSKAQLVFLMNAVLWATATWLIIRILNKQKHQRLRKCKNDSCAPQVITDE